MGSAPLNIFPLTSTKDHNIIIYIKKIKKTMYTNNYKEKQRTYTNNEIKFLSFSRTFLNGFSNKQLENISKLFIETKFFDAIPYYLNYIKGLKGQEKLTQEEITKIKNIAENTTTNPFHNLFVENIIVDAEDLYLTMLIHSQRCFNQLNTKNDKNASIRDKKNKYLFDDRIRTLARNAASTNFLNINPNNIENLAIFGATYTRMKKRALSGLRLFKDMTNNKKEPKEIVLLTGFRDTYLSELKQLGITKINDKKFKKLEDKIDFERENKSGQVRAKDAIIFFKNHKNENIEEYIDRTQLLIVLNKLSKFGVKIPKDLENLDTIDIFNIFTENTTERELGLLAVSDINLDKKYKVNSIFTNDTNDTTGRRANSQDTIRAYINKGYPIDKTLFVSDDLFVQQQHMAVLDVLNNNGQTEDLSKVSTTGLPINENIFYATDKNPNPALNSTASSLFCALNMAINNLSDIKYDINNLKAACNGASSKKIDFSKGYTAAYDLGASFVNSGENIII